MIAEAFHRTGAVEVWGRGTNRVIAECRSHGIAPPTFEERQGFLVATFRARLAEPPQATPQATPQVVQVLTVARQACSFANLQKALGLKDRVHFLKAYLEPLLAAGWIERTIPDKPRSPRQRYRTTTAGEKLIEKGGKAGSGRTGCHPSASAQRS